MNNYFCMLCDKVATRVCVHPKCDKSPFLCGDKCKHEQNMALTLHTHDGQTRLLRCEEMLAKVAAISKGTSLTQHLDSLRRRMHMLIGDLNELLNGYES